jgi:hypothetical protein
MVCRKMNGLLMGMLIGCGNMELFVQHYIVIFADVDKGFS